ncbi:hypothetical protein II898_06305 [bacterium]|nr:hypothetical protein [bacterium]
MREKFVFFKNFKTVADRLPDDLRLKFYDAVTAYVFEEKEPDDVVIAALVDAIKPSLDKEDKRGGNHNPTGQNQHSAVKTGQTRSNEVKKEIEPDKAAQKGQSFLEIRNKKQEKNISEDKSPDIFQKKKTTEKSFTPPTLEDVKAYIAERGCAAVVDAKKFFDYFEAGRWHDSEGKPVRNWKQKLITWETHGRQTRTLKAAQGLLGVKSGTYAEDVPL